MEAPSGTVEAYRTACEPCTGWRELTGEAQCTLQPGAVVALGPGPSVSAATCGDPTGKESDPANTHALQRAGDDASKRADALDCTAAVTDKAGPADLSKKPAQP